MEVETKTQDKLSDSQLDSLLTLTKKFEDEDRDFYRTYAPELKLHEEYWNGFQQLVWDDVKKDFTLPTSAQLYEIGEGDEGIYDRVVNIVRAHGESIIAALSASIPKVVFFPEDADVEEDRITSEAFSRLSEKIHEDNGGKLLWLRALYILWNQGVICAYNFEKEDYKYGKVESPVYKEVEQTIQYCPECDTIEESEICPICKKNTEKRVEKRKELDKYEISPGCKEKIKLYGMLNVRAPWYLKSQSELPYILLEDEQHTAVLKYNYRDVDGDITYGIDEETAYYRHRTSFYSDIHRSLTTVRTFWIRPWAFFYLDDKEEAEDLLERFPKGCKVVKIGNSIADWDEEALDDHWTISHSPMSKTLFSDALVKPLIPIQDATNDLFNIFAQAVEYGIPETFVDPAVLDLDKYKTERSQPGMKYPAKSNPGRSIKDGFYESSTADVPEVAGEFYNKVEQAGQYTVGALPSIYGGILKGSRTASEYGQSRNYALQRLSLSWILLNEFHADLMSTSTRSYVAKLRGDLKYVDRDNGVFVNIFIRKASFTGKIGKVKTESSDQIPSSWSEQREVLIELITLNNPAILESLFTPENAPAINRAIGLPNVSTPGLKDRNKQYSEFSLLLQGQEISPDDYDNHIIHAESCRTFLISDVGMMLRSTNIDGYMAIENHMKAHMDISKGESENV